MKATLTDTDAEKAAEAYLLGLRRLVMSKRERRNARRLREWRGMR